MVRWALLYTLVPVQHNLDLEYFAQVADGCGAGRMPRDTYLSDAIGLLEARLGEMIQMKGRKQASQCNWIPAVDSSYATVVSTVHGSLQEKTVRSTGVRRRDVVPWRLFVLL